MNPDIRKRWVEALRSSEYEQGRWVLRHGDKFCCLGVLCDLAEKEGVVGSIVHPTGIYAYGGDREAKTLPSEVYRWAGLAGNILEVRAGKGYVSLAALNDRGETFGHIADLIEGQL